MSLIFVIGPRGAGKSSAGALLARSLGFAFLDVDRMVEERAGESIAGIVAREGWDAFRAREAAALREAAGAARAVVACGGGVVLHPENRTLLRAHGLVLWLDAPAEILWGRLARDPSPSQRPALTDAEPKAELEETLRRREPLYAETAHRRIDAGGPLQDVVARMRKAAGDAGLLGLHLSERNPT